MMKRAAIHIAFALLLAGSGIFLLGRSMVLEAPNELGTLPLYATLPSTKDSDVERWTLFFGQRVVRNVTVPTLTPILPYPSRATGAAVIIAPGGGFQMLSMDNEGWPVAHWFAERGVAAFVLKYRLQRTPDSDLAWLATVIPRIVSTLLGPGGRSRLRSYGRRGCTATRAAVFCRAGAGRPAVRRAAICHRG
jgi:hypothetical protein